MEAQSDSDSIQFAPEGEDDAESIQFQEELDATARSALSRRSRASSQRNRLGRASAPSVAGTAADGDGADSVVFIEDNASVASSIPGKWFLNPSFVKPAEEGGLDAGRRPTSAVASPTILGMVPSGKQTSNRARSVIVSSDDEVLLPAGGRDRRPTRKMVSSDEDGGASTSRRRGNSHAKGEVDTAKLAARVGGSASQLSNQSITNQSIQFSVVDEDDEPTSKPGQGVAVVASSSAGSGNPNSASASPPGKKKTVVSNTLRERGQSLKGLKQAVSTRGAIDVQVTDDQQQQQQATEASKSGRDSASSRVAHPAALSLYPQTVQVDVTTNNEEEEKGDTRDQDGLTFPAFFAQTATTGASSAAAAATALPKTPTPHPTPSKLLEYPAKEGATLPLSLQAAVVHHARTDSNRLVLEHLKDQEASNVFVQHKAMMLQSPLLSQPPPVSASSTGGAAVDVGFPGLDPSEATKVQERRVRAPPKATITSTSLQANLPGPSQPPRRTASASPPTASKRSKSNAAYAAVLAPSASARSEHPAGQQPLSSLPLDLVEAKRLTEAVRQFNGVQQAELQHLDARLYDAQCNDSTRGGGGGGGGGGSGLLTVRRRGEAAASRGNTAKLNEQQQRSKSLSSGRGDVKANCSSAKDMVHLLHEVAQAAERKQQSSSSCDRGGAVVNAAPVTTAVYSQIMPKYRHGAALAAGPGSLSMEARAAAAAGERRSREQQSLDDVVRSTAAALSVIPPPRAAYADVIETLAASPSSSSAASSHLFFTTGVRLTPQQQRDFYRTVQQRYRGHCLDKEEVIQAVLDANAMAFGGGSRIVASTGVACHATRSAAVGTAALVSTLNKQPQQSSSSSSHPQHHPQQLPHPKRIKQRTEVLRHAFDLLDMEGRGVLLRGDLPMLRQLLMDECDLLAVPLILSNRNKNTAVASGVDLDQSLVAAAARCKAADKRAFAMVSAAATHTAIGASPAASDAASCSFMKYGCTDRATFRRLCRFAGDIVVPILQSSAFEEIEFPHFSMLVLHHNTSAATGETVQSYLEYLRRH